MSEENQKTYSTFDQDNSSVSIQSTSNVTSDSSPIVLRETGNTRLVFKAMLLKDNPNDDEANLKGVFVFQKRDGTSPWVDIDEHNLTTLKHGEGFKLILKSSEVKLLLEGIESRKAILDQHGFTIGTREFVIIDKQWSGVFLHINDSPERATIVENLQKLEKSNFQELQTAINIAKIKEVIKIYESNMQNSDESFWQKFLEENSWILQQVFSYPVAIIQGETYVGGKNTKGRNGQGGSSTDFLIKLQSSCSFGVIEIKTPRTPLIGGEYRSESFSTSADLSGSVIQLQNQLTLATEHFCQQVGTDFPETNTIEPQGLLIIGNLAVLSPEQKRSFFLFRKSVSNIKIVTFDEMFDRIQILEKLIES